MCRRLKSLISGDRGIAAFKPDDEELQRSEYYRRALDNAPDVIWILDLKTKRFRYVSAAVVKLRGYTPEEVIAQPLDEAFTPESAKKVSELIAFWNAKLPEKPAHPGSITIEVDQPCKDGSVIHTEVTVALVANGSRTVEVIGVSRNISARKKAAQELAASVERFRQFIESSHDIVWEVDAKGRYTYVSSGSKELLGCDPSEILGKTAFDFMSPEEMARVRSIFLSHAVEKKPFFRLINLRRRKDGGEVVLETSGVPYFDAEEKFLGFRGINHDITARTRSEEALRESEERFRNLVDASIEALVVHDRGVIVDVNPAFVRLFGYDSPEEITGRDCEFLLSPESADRVHKRISNQENGFLEITGIRKDGSTFIGELDSRPLNYRGRNARIASIRDITERKRAEHELARSEAELLAIYEHTPVMQCLLDKDLRIVRANRAMVEFSRRSPEELVGLAIGEVLGCTHFIDDRCRCGSGTPGGAKCPFRQSIIRVLETGNP
ncbi:MAG TPA: PAS domain S-box protein, partial [Dissulfurispiraceae bacterium]|nr:PAS domain S-box protein [Dissulfurispiraceae bacterium]